MKQIQRANQDIRRYAKESAVYLWELADGFNVSVETLNRRLRHELEKEEKEKAFQIIDEIKESRNDNKGNR